MTILLTTSIPAVVYGTPGFNVGGRRVCYRGNDTIWHIPFGTLITANGTVSCRLYADKNGSAAEAGDAEHWVIIDSDPNVIAVETTC